MGIKGQANSALNVVEVTVPIRELLFLTIFKGDVDLNAHFGAQIVPKHSLTRRGLKPTRVGAGAMPSRCDW